MALATEPGGRMEGSAVGGATYDRTERRWGAGVGEG